MLVRATILYSVDPHADEFQPLTAPRLTAWGLAAWPAMGLLAALLMWIPRMLDATEEMTGAQLSTPGWIAPLSLLAIVASGLGALALLRPSPSTPRRNVVLAAIGAAMYAPVLWLLWRLWSFPLSRPYIDLPPNPDRILIRLELAGALLVMLLALRPNARRLVARCLALRTGRVQRQTILATIGAVLLTVVGDLIRLAAIPADSETLELVGMLTVLMGSILTTAAIAGATLDSWRISRAILAPSPTLEGLFEEHPEHHDSGTPDDGPDDGPDDSKVPPTGDAGLPG